MLTLPNNQIVHEKKFLIIEVFELKMQDLWN